MATYFNNGHLDKIKNFQQKNRTTLAVISDYDLSSSESWALKLKNYIKLVNLENDLQDFSVQARTAGLIVSSGLVDQIISATVKPDLCIIMLGRADCYARTDLTAYYNSLNTIISDLMAGGVLPLVVSGIVEDYNQSLSPNLFDYFSKNSYAARTNSIYDYTKLIGDFAIPPKPNCKNFRTAQNINQTFFDSLPYGLNALGHDLVYKNIVQLLNQPTLFYKFYGHLTTNSYDGDKLVTTGEDGYSSYYKSSDLNYYGQHHTGEHQMVFDDGTNLFNFANNPTRKVDLWKADSNSPHYTDWNLAKSNILNDVWEGQSFYPYALKHTDGYFYLIFKENDSFGNVRMFRSQDGETWEQMNNGNPLFSQPMDCVFWNPGIVFSPLSEGGQRLHIILETGARPSLGEEGVWWGGHSYSYCDLPSELVSSTVIDFSPNYNSTKIINPHIGGPTMLFSAATNKMVVLGHSYAGIIFGDSVLGNGGNSGWLRQAGAIAIQAAYADVSTDLTDPANWNLSDRLWMCDPLNNWADVCLQEMPNGSPAKLQLSFSAGQTWCSTSYSDIFQVYSDFNLDEFAQAISTPIDYNPTTVSDISFLTPLFIHAEPQEIYSLAKGKLKFFANSKWHKARLKKFNGASWKNMNCFFEHSE